MLIRTEDERDKKHKLALNTLRKASFIHTLVVLTEKEIAVTV